MDLSFASKTHWLSLHVKHCPLALGSSSPSCWCLQQARNQSEHPEVRQETKVLPLGRSWWKPQAWDVLDAVYMVRAVG